MYVDGVMRVTLIDSGCSQCIVYAPYCASWTRKSVDVLTVSGQRQHCEGDGRVQLRACNGGAVVVDVYVVGFKPLGFDFILGINGISALGGVTISPSLATCFELPETDEKPVCASAIKIEEADFCISFGAIEKAWTVAWKWSDNAEPDALRNRVAEYSIPPTARLRYEEEIEQWITNGWLKHYDDEKFGPAKGLIPLMEVNKDTVRPVVDFRELNSHEDAFTASADVCADKLREWRRLGTMGSIVDLRRAYLQIPCISVTLPDCDISWAKVLPH